MIEKLFGEAFAKNASDIHLTVGVPPILRINGNLVKLDSFERLKPDDTKSIAMSLLSDAQKEIFEEKGEIDFSYSLQTRGRFRINAYKQRGSISIAIRPIPLETPKLEDLMLPEILKDMAMMDRGLFLVTGPTGSGKSSTLASMISYINSHKTAHIITLEDPIEFLHKHKSSIIDQREIGTDSLSFSNALRGALRQDPDIILVGEMRDLETIQIAITAAETGHLVLSSLHTNGAASTVERIIDVFPSPQQQQIKVQLANVLNGVISQQLLKYADNHGRVVACEIMIGNKAVRNNIREGKTHQIMSSIQTGSADGMISMDNYIVSLYKKNLISYDEALSHCIEKNSFNIYR
ncbi:MAG: type IV pilus twitching motility protein PilT [Peptostreptococcaceae bacterium]|nr:type IV pilus twitching motility protein PilT [Peptostreptococcaceae bacterium]